MSKDIIVLAPNGRRQTVKCTLNTTILQILEEVCKKQSLDAGGYNLTHHNKVLDLTNTIRFSNLPNRATLEMVEVEQRRQENNVTIALQLENGERHVGEFMPQSTLYDVVTNLAPSELSACRHPTVVYTRREVHGLQELQNTTIRQLGLTGGRAALWLIDKSLEELKTQANISSALPPRHVQVEESKPTTSKVLSNAEQSWAQEPLPGPSDMTKHQPEVHRNYPFKLIKDEIKRKANANAIDENDEHRPMDIAELSRTKEENSVVDMDVDTSELFKCASKASVADSMTGATSLTEQELQRRLNIEQEVTFLGENKAIAFVQSLTEPELSELPDDFYELTVDEVRKLYHELRQNVNAATNAPLLTAEQRIAQQTQSETRASHKHAVVRIQFPDRFILQGVFEPTDTIQQVHDFTKQYLKEAQRPFQLYTTPTREALDLGLSLAQASFVPGVLMHFRWADDGASEAPFFKEHVYKNSTSSEAAAMLASKYRMSARQKREVLREQQKQTTQAGKSTTKDGKLPKWFKLKS